MIVPSQEDRCRQANLAKGPEQDEKNAHIQHLGTTDTDETSRNNFTSILGPRDLRT
jgi:hypothetical protein